MKNGRLSLSAALATVFAMFAASPATAQQTHCDRVTAMTEAGTFEAEGTSAGFMVGARWGDGVLTLKDGSKHKFSFHGLKALDTGVTTGKIAGTIYNLANVADFEGAYQGASATLTVVKQATEGEVIFNNNKCVVVKAKAVTQGLRLSPPGPAIIDVKFEK